MRSHVTRIGPVVIARGAAIETGAMANHRGRWCGPALFNRDAAITLCRVPNNATRVTLQQPRARAPIEPVLLRGLASERR